MTFRYGGQSAIGTVIAGNGVVQLGRFNREISRRREADPRKCRNSSFGLVFAVYPRLKGNRTSLIRETELVREFAGVA
jgi:hypothetical protein